MSHRFDQDKQTLQRHIHSGHYGRLDYLVGRNTWTCRKRGQWGLEYPYEIADPLLIEALVHHFDIMRSLTRANAESVHCVTWNPEWSEFQGDPQAVMLVEVDYPNQYRAIGWVQGKLYTVVYEVREDKEGEYYHLVTLWKATKQEMKTYEENI